MKSFKKIPIHVVEEHNDALQHIYSAIGGKKLPLEGTTLVHIDAHPDMLIDRKLKGADARAGRKVLPLLQIENWIVPAAAAGHIEHVVWLRPPWAKQFKDGSRFIRVGDQTSTGLLRVDSTESYYLSDALYSSKIGNERKFKLTVAELGLNYENSQEYAQKLKDNINFSEPFVLDIDLDFFSTGNPFLSLYENIKLYDRLEEIFGFELPKDTSSEVIEEFVRRREEQLNELEKLFQHLEEYNNFENYNDDKTKLFHMVADLANDITLEAKRLNEPVDWWAIYAGGCTRDQGGLPYHISSEDEIYRLLNNFKCLLEVLPPPVLITVARSTEDGYCPPDQVENIQSLVIQTLKELYNTDDPQLHYLTVNTNQIFD